MTLSTASARYCIVVVGVAALMLAAAVAFNTFVDPFGMLSGPARDGVGEFKPAIHTRVRLFKAYEIARVRPRTIVLGSSRTHVGIRCSHPALQQLSGPCYNLAFDGATTREMYAYLVHAEAIRPLAAVVLGLDAYHLSNAEAGVRPDFDAEILLGPSGGRMRRLIAGDLRVLASASTLEASIDTLRRRDEREPEWFAADGQRLGEVFFRREGEDFVERGPRAYFDEVDRLEIGFQTEPAAAPGHRGGSRDDPDQSSIAYVRRIVDFCRDHRIDLRIFVTPAHAHQLEIAALTGGGAALDEGKREFARLLADDAARHPLLAPIVAIDFSGYSAETEEDLPPPASRDEMANYWESSHFKSSLGDRVLDRLFGRQEPGAPASPDFGVPVALATVDEALAEQRHRQARYRARHPEEVATLGAWVAEARADRRATAGAGAR